MTNEPVGNWEVGRREVAGVSGLSKAWAQVHEFVVSPDGERLAVGCDDPAVRFFDTASKELVMTITVHKKAVRGLAFSPDGTKLATASEDKTFHVSPLRFDELYEAAKQLHSATSGIRP